jgi:hypothetical protein
MAFETMMVVWLTIPPALSSGGRRKKGGEEEKSGAALFPQKRAPFAGCVYREDGH